MMQRLFADLLTLLRASIALLLPWLGYRQGASSLPLAVYLMLIAWMSDFFDGAVARTQPETDISWLGKHDLQVDMGASAGLLLYLRGADFISTRFALGYVLVWTVIFWYYGFSKATGSLVQAPIYGGFLWVAGQMSPQASLWVLIWVSVLLLFTWRKFIYEVIPEFLGDMGEVLRRKHV